MQSYIQEVHRKFRGWRSAAEVYEQTLNQSELGPVLAAQNTMLLRFEEYIFATIRWERALVEASRVAQASSQPLIEEDDS